MAGHSKWANIKHRKAAQDAKRGKIFTKLIRELTIAAKQGGPAPEDNPRLRAAVDKALGANMTRDTIDRAIARGAGASDADNMEELTYEGYAAARRRGDDRGGASVHVDPRSAETRRGDHHHAVHRHLQRGSGAAGAFHDACDRARPFVNPASAAKECDRGDQGRPLSQDRG